MKRTYTLFFILMLYRLRAERAVRVTQFWAPSPLSPPPPPRVTSSLVTNLSRAHIVSYCLILSQAVWARCWWPRRPQPAPHRPAEQITRPSPAVVCHRHSPANRHYASISDVSSTIPQSTSSGSEDQSSSVNISAVALSDIRVVHFWHDTKLTEFVTIFQQIRNNEAAVMKPTSLLR